MWQEYARHLYGHLGGATRRSLRFEQPGLGGSEPDEHCVQDVVFGAQMRCLSGAVEELHTQGWLPNQVRMWVASHWSVDRRCAWQDGEEWFYRHLLDGSRAANRLGWQWTAGTATGRPYGFSRVQVDRRAPGLCEDCALGTACPIETPPQISDPVAIGSSITPTDPVAVAGPLHSQIAEQPELIWITAESLGDDDPALAHWPQVPVGFVFDEALLRRLQLSAKRLVFITERLAELSRERETLIYRGQADQILTGTRLGATHTPVPGWQRLRTRLHITSLHPWPWLVRPGRQRLQSFSAWRSST